MPQTNLQPTCNPSNHRQMQPQSSSPPAPPALPLPFSLMKDVRIREARVWKASSTPAPVRAETCRSQNIILRHQQRPPPPSPPPSFWEAFRKG